MARPSLQLSQHPDLGKRYAAGTVTSVFRNRRDRHALTARFRCSSCNQRGLCRLTRLRTGAQKSCGCLKVSCFVAYHEALAASVSAGTSEKVFEAVERSGRDGVTEAARKFRLSRSLVSFIWRRTRAAKVVAVPAPTRKLVREVASRRGFAQAAALIKLSVSVAMAVVRLGRKMELEALAAAKKAGIALRDALRTAAFAVEDLREPIDSRGMPRYRSGEYTRNEVQGKARGGPIWAAFHLLKAAVVPVVDKPIVERFIDAMELTVSRRAARQRYFVADLLRKEREAAWSSAAEPEYMAA